MASFVDHLQIVPMPHRDGRRQPDGDHRPGGLGNRTIADRLEQRGWVARIEDMSYDKPMPQGRLVEAYARGLSDAVASAWDRNRFPLLILRSNYGALGPIDALGEGLGVAWIGPHGAYAKRGLLSRVSLDRCALSFVTGRMERDRFAVHPVRLPGKRIVVAGARRTNARERFAMEADGINVTKVEGLPAAVAVVPADTWYLHVDVNAFPSSVTPGADEPDDKGPDAAAAARAIGDAFRGRSLKALALAHYDLNKDEGGRTLDALVEIIESAVVAAGGVPNPRAREPA